MMSAPFEARRGETVSGTFVAATPLPEATGWKLELSGRIEIVPDGKVGMLRVTACPRERRIAVEHALRLGVPPAAWRGRTSSAAWTGLGSR